MDPDVSRRKFHQQVEHIRAYIEQQRPGFRWRVRCCRYPRIIIEMGRPAGRVPYVVEVWAKDWDARPPAYRFVVPTRPQSVLPAKQWPRGHPFLRRHQPVGKNRVANRPFICLRGTRDYHEDQRHRDVGWEQNCRGKDEFSILAMLVIIQMKINTVHGWLPNDRTQPLYAQPVAQNDSRIQAGA